MTNRSRRSVALVLIALSLAGCTGLIGEPGSDPRAIDDPPITPIDPPSSPEPSFLFDLSQPSHFGGLRMMTTEEYAATVVDLTGVRPDTTTMPTELEVFGLENDATRLIMRDVGHMRVFLEAATAVAAEVDVDSVIPCGAASCSDDELRAFLSRAFVEEVDAEGLAAYRERHDAAVADKGLDFGRRAVVQMALISPRFLYRTELAGAGGLMRAHDLAKKLSYFLWGTTPDARLYELAQSGALLDDATYSAEVDRLLADARAHERITGFIFEWLGIDDFDLATKDAAVDLPAGFARAMEDEVRMLVRVVLFENHSPLDALFTADFAYVNASLAAHYGIAGDFGDSLERVSLEGTGRRGILTTALVLAAHSKESGRSPMQRGHFLVADLMCSGFPSDAGIPAMALPDATAGETFRDRFVPLETTTPCMNCHRVLNAGFAFELFDEVGRDQPPGVVLPEEVRGFFDLPPYDRIEFTDAVTAIDGFAAHPALRRCFVTQTYRFAEGRLPGSDDVATLEALTRGFDAGRDVLTLFGEVARSERFRMGVSR